MKASFQRYITAVKNISGMSDHYFSVEEKTVIDTDCTLMGGKENANWNAFVSAIQCLFLVCSLAERSYTAYAGLMAAKIIQGL